MKAGDIFPLKFVISIVQRLSFQPERFYHRRGKFGSFQSRCQLVLSVSSAAKAQNPIIAAMTHATNLQFAICLVLLPAAGVGTFGNPCECRAVLLRIL